MGTTEQQAVPVRVLKDIQTPVSHARMTSCPKPGLLSISAVRRRMHTTMQYPRNILIAAALIGTSSVSAQTSYPMIMSVSPVAAQAGQTSEHTLESRYSMFGAYRVLVSGAGVTGDISTKMELGKDGKEPSLTKIKLKFAVAEDALPGVRDFRVIGPTGASTLGQIVVTKDPVLIEAPKNDTAATAQKITLPGNVCAPCCHKWLPGAAVTDLDTAADADCLRPSRKHCSPWKCCRPAARPRSDRSTEASALCGVMPEHRTSASAGASRVTP